MVVFKVAYMPKFSKQFLALVHDYCTSSMQDEQQTMEQFEIDHIDTTFKEEDIELLPSDSELFDQLSKENVHYIEISSKQRIR